ncbi:hypothetical protein FZEAL_9060 [Fusarium zealandicum]|uniref:3CxxC-type domain-containing protein n=1 Tax=Fusarium zealandicum TaxID=1053134 RepID=A0A8H4UDK2_9HYPO|nr:hypothetical protein FZEAL_9060 [Fusarium zealandicum]
MTPTSSMFPALHGKVSRLLQEDDLYFEFYEIDDDQTCTKDYDTNIMGRFSCRNPRCSTNGWSSKKITIRIRMYGGDRYNAKVYHQRCKACNSLSRPYVDDKSYADRIAYRIKKWQGIQMHRPHYGGESNAPHKEHLCEGCRDGHCTQSRGYQYD